MNYFAHGYAFLDDPYFLVGTAVPDWLSVIDRRMRARSKRARQFVEDKDRRIAAIAAGVVRHHHDDHWFHRTRAFAELHLQLSADIRELLPADDGFRPSFLGHILVEILLDATLIAESPARLGAYYAAIAQADPQLVNDTVNRLATRESRLLVDFIPKFCSVRFLYDYVEDEKLLWRLNHVMRRVKLPALPNDFLTILPGARRRVSRRRDELLAGVAKDWAAGRK
jgi:hypothetical protein